MHGQGNIESCLNIREVADPLGAFRIDIVVEPLADGADSTVCLAIGLMIVSGSHNEINLDVGHKLHPEAGGELGITIRNYRSGEIID